MRASRVEVLGLSQEPIDQDQARKLWQRYKKKPTEALRNQLMELYLPVVRYNAERLHAKLPDQVEVDDLMSSGLFGLMDAIDGFDLALGFKFETYCTRRVRGAILDELRAMDWVPRLVRQRTSQVENTRRMFAMERGYNPTEEEIKQEMSVDSDEFEKIRRDSSPAGVSSLSRRCYQSDAQREVREIDVLNDKRQRNPLTVAQKQDLKELITRGLSRSERMIVILYYYEEMTMREIGRTLDLSESRVSQMHTSIMQRLKAQLASRDAELTAISVEA